MNFIVAHRIRETEFLASFDRTRLAPANFVPGSAGCQPAAFGSLPNAPVNASVLTSWIRVHGRLPRTTGQRSVLPDKECRDGAIAFKN
jgi:hypothetical protein